MARVVIRIDRLVLHGVDLKRRDAVVEGLRSGLLRELARPEVAARWAGSSHRESLRDNTPCDGEGAALGNEAARRIAKGGPA